MINMTYYHPNKNLIFCFMQYIFHEEFALIKYVQNLIDSIQHNYYDNNILLPRFKGFHYCRCFLRTDSFFIWSFIGPVILIFLVNIGFFLMTLCRIWTHQRAKSQTKNNNNACAWIKMTLSLTIIMGLNWILGLLLVLRTELTFMVYIFTILVAFQGLFIFIIFIIFSESVQNGIRKWWKNRAKKSKELRNLKGKKTNLSKEVRK